MKIFEVPRRKIAVNVHLDGGGDMVGQFFADARGPGGGPGLLSDRLNDESELFLPLASRDSRFLVQKSRILYVRLGEQEGEVADLDGPEIHTATVRINLAGGAQLEGLMPYTMPEGQTRTLDYLNAAPLFFPLSDEGRVTLVNRDYIVSVSGSEEPRGPESP